MAYTRNKDRVLHSFLFFLFNSRAISRLQRGVGSDSVRRILRGGSSENLKWTDYNEKVSWVILVLFWL
jgi:hypothetical protein